MLFTVQETQYTCAGLTPYRVAGLARILEQDLFPDIHQLTFLKLQESCKLRWMKIFHKYEWLFKKSGVMIHIIIFSVALQSLKTLAASHVGGFLSYLDIW
jgi:hypothetical protein